MDGQNILRKKDNGAKEKAGLKAGVISAAINLLLSASKIVCGLIFGAVSVLADGLNNLSDLGSNVVTIVGFKVAAKPADKEHPYGHARIEYIAALIAAFLIMLVAVELLSESVQKIIDGSKSEFSVLSVIVLSVSIAAKAFMGLYNRKLGKKYNSESLKATATDSISDCVATFVVLVGTLVAHFFEVETDGYLGCGIAVLIAVAGVGILRKTTSALMGESPDKEVTDAIKSIIASYDGVYGVHDLAVHSYGDKYYASVHVEVDASVDVMESHELIDSIEKYFADNTDVVLVIHLDPVVVGDEKVERLKTVANQKLKQLDENYSLHDFRVVDGKNRINLIFDVAIPYKAKHSAEEICDYMTLAMKETDQRLCCVISVEHQLIK